MYNWFKWLYNKCSWHCSKNNTVRIKGRTITSIIIIIIVVPVPSVSNCICYLFCCLHCENIEKCHSNYKRNNIKVQGNLSFRLSPFQITLCLSMTSLYRYILHTQVNFQIFSNKNNTHHNGKYNGWYGTQKNVQISNK